MSRATLRRPHDELTALASVMMDAVGESMRSAKIDGVDVVVLAVKKIDEDNHIGIGSTISDMTELSKVFLHAVVAVGTPEVVGELAEAFKEMES